MTGNVVIDRRRLLLRMELGATAFAASYCIALAETYPARPVDVIVPYTAAGGTDIMARLIGQSLSE